MCGRGVRAVENLGCIFRGGAGDCARLARWRALQSEPRPLRERCGAERSPALELVPKTIGDQDGSGPHGSLVFARGRRWPHCADLVQFGRLPGLIGFRFNGWGTPLKNILANHRDRRLVLNLLYGGDKPVAPLGNRLDVISSVRGHAQLLSKDRNV